MSTEHQYPKKYWWIVVIIVPIVVAIIGILPEFLRQQPTQRTPVRTWRLKGRVFDEQTELPIRGANVTVEYQGKVSATDTDSEGMYHVTVQAEGTTLVVRVRAEGIGYQAYDRVVELAESNMSLAPISLVPLVSAVPPTRIPVEPPLIPTATPRSTATPIPLPSATPLPRPSPTPRPKPASKDWAVLIVDDSGKANRTLSSQIGDLLRKQGKRLSSPSLFSGAFVSNGDFDRLFDGSSDDAARLEAQAFFKYAVLGRRSVSFTQQDASLENVLTATVTLELHVVEGASGAVVNSATFEQNGAGFSKSKAEQAANERILQEARSAISPLVQ